MFSICISVLIDFMLIMIQLDKELVFNDQLKFNLDSSTPVSSRYGFSSPGVIIIQKLPSQFKKKAITTSKVHQMQPISSKLSLAMKVAKLDASNYLKNFNGIKDATRKKKEKVKQTDPSDVKINASKQKPRFKIHSSYYQKPKHHSSPQTKSLKTPKGIHFSKTSFRQPNYIPSSDTWSPKTYQQEYHTLLKDACTSTCDLSKNCAAVESKFTFCTNKKAVSPITIAKLKKNNAQKTPKKDIGIPYYLTPQKNKSINTPNPVKEKSLIGKKINRPRQDNAIKRNNKNRSVKAYDYNKTTKPTSPKQFSSDQRSSSYFDKPSVKHTFKSSQDEKPFYGNKKQIRFMYERLLDMEDLERSIRSRWVEIKYERVEECDQKPVSVECCNAPENPAVVDISGGPYSTSKPTKEPFKLISKKRPIDSPAVHFTNFSSWKKAQKSLFLPTKTVESVYQNKSNFSDYLRLALHEPKGKFDPWSVVNELSDDIAHHVVNDVCNEVNDHFDGCIELLFENEFKDPEE